jgi:outer membrane biosynthesis protein TonB
MKAEARDPGLTFEWPRDGDFPFLLCGCVAASLAAHAAAFFLFRVADPPSAWIARPAPQVSVLTASSPEAIAALEWIAAQDPARTATAASVPPPGLLEGTYRPSYAGIRAAPLDPAETPVVVPFPAVRDALAVISSTAAQPAPPPVHTAPQPTAVSFSESMSRRAPKSLPAFTAKTRSTTPIEPTRYLIGVTANGEVRFVFLQSSSGNPALDQQAAAHLEDVVFAPDAAPITWASAVVTWGDETYAESGL